MATFVVETYVPDGDPERFAIDVDGLRAALARGLGRRAQHLRSYLVETDAMGFHMVEAGTAAEVARVTDAAGLEVERIVEATGLDRDA